MKNNGTLAAATGALVLCALFLAPAARAADPQSPAAGISQEKNMGASPALERPADSPRTSMWVILGIWAGVALLLVRLDVRLSKLEKKING
jgi:hypothetical protein